MEAAKLFPNDIKTEKAILGLAIIHNDLVNILLEKVKANDFFDLRNELVFRTIEELSFEGRPIDITNVNNKLEITGRLKDVGDFSYVATLIDGSFYKANYESYLDIIVEKSTLRKLLAFGDLLINKINTTKETSEELIGEFSERLFKLSNYDTKEGLVKAEKILEETFRYIHEMSNNNGDITGVTTGFRDLDRELSGLQRSDFVLLAARPSMGKTALGMHIGLNAALKGKKKVAVFSLEMSKRQLVQRILSILSRVDLANIISGKISDEDMKLLMHSTKEFKELDLFIDDTASISLTELRAKAKRMKVEHGIDLIVIDYLQLMTIDVGRNENRQQEISNISRGLKGLAKELNIPVLALSQLSRKSEERSNKRPMLSDLRESGAIEQDADVAMLLYRDDYYDQESPEANIIEVIIAKHRNGPTGTVKLFFEKSYTSFSDLEYNNENYN